MGRINVISDGGGGGGGGTSHIASHQSGTVVHDGLSTLEIDIDEVILARSVVTARISCTTDIGSEAPNTIFTENTFVDTDTIKIRPRTTGLAFRANWDVYEFNNINNHQIISGTMTSDGGGGEYSTQISIPIQVDPDKCDIFFSYRVSTTEFNEGLLSYRIDDTGENIDVYCYSIDALDYIYTAYVVEFE